MVVTGIRRAIERPGADQAQPLESIVEAVSSEDIGKLPETSIAESLARLPGVTAQRVDGPRLGDHHPRHGAEVLRSPCSMAARWCAPATNRLVEYDQFPAELIERGHRLQDARCGVRAQARPAPVNTVTVSLLSIRSPCEPGTHVLSATPMAPSCPAPAPPATGSAPATSTSPPTGRWVLYAPGQPQPAALLQELVVGQLGHLRAASAA